MKMRRELKYPINAFDRELLRTRLALALERDENAGADGCYLVRSLYFDTPYDAALLEKIAGADMREKFRLRFYPGSANLSIALEKKVKARGLCGKEKAALTVDECRRIIAGDYSWMAGGGRELLAEFCAKARARLLRPKTIVEYRREAFVCRAGNTRVTIDSDIRSGIFADGFSRRDLPLVPVTDGLIVMEVKHDEFMPAFVADLLRMGDRRISTCSKYAMGRQFV